TAGRAIEIPGPRFLIGRDPSADLRPNSQAISRNHAAIELRQGRVFLRDLGTTNGTLHNNRLLRDQESEVRHGDRLTIGPLQFTLTVLAERPLPKRVVVRLGNVGEISPRGAGMLSAHAQRLERAGGGLRLCDVHPETAETLEHLPVSLPIDSFPTVDEAIALP